MKTRSYPQFRLSATATLITRIAACFAVLATALRAEIISNGGFEQPFITGEGALFSVGASPPGWTVTSGSVDIHTAAYFAPHQGSQSLDLDGISAGTIEQTFMTGVGRSYHLTFAYANNGRGGTIPASANVSLSGLGPSDLLSQTITHGDSTRSNMNYQFFSYVFVANSTATTLRFTSLDPGGSNGGLVLDDVSVTPVASDPAAPKLSASVGGVVVNDVSVTPIPNAPPTANLSIRGSQFELSWDTSPYVWYQVQYRAALTTGAWTPLSTNWLQGNGGKFCIRDTILPDSPQRFYRVAATNALPQP